MIPSRYQGVSPGTVAACGALILACSTQIDGQAPGAGASATGGSSTSGSGPSAGGTTGAVGGSTQGGGAGSGGSGATGGTGPLPPEPPPFQAAAGMLRRLTRAQFQNAVQDVFGVEVDVALLDADNWAASFATIGAASVVTPERGVEQYHAAIEAAANAVFDDPARREGFVGCTPNGTPEDSCLRGFVEGLGRRAWRRPLEATEVDGLATLAAGAATELGGAWEGVRWATVALFTSPNFLYRAELGAPAASGALRYTGYEMASRLGFLLWNGLADDALLDRAGAGALSSVAGVRAEAERLLDAPAGRQAIGAFAEEFMRLDRIGTQAKDSALYPEYGPALRTGMVRDMRGTWEVLAFDERASALELFTTTKVVANAELASLYGLAAPGLGSDTFAVLGLPAGGPRVGILGKAGFLSQFANQKEGSPTLRGKFIREALMCTPIEPPPGDVDVVLPEPDPSQPRTKRDRLEIHRLDPTCAGCHWLMDPLGLPFETFDAIGRYRTTEHGLTIDPSGEFDEQLVADSRELGVVMSTSSAVARCLVRKYYTYATGHAERDVDGSVINALSTAFEASGYRLRELVLEVVTHEAFASVAPQP